MSGVSIQSLGRRFTTRQRNRIALVSVLAMMLALLPGIVGNESAAEAAAHPWIGSAAGAHRAFDPGVTYGRPGSDLWESGFPKGFIEGDTVPFKMENITGAVDDLYKFNICLDETDNRQKDEIAFTTLAPYDTSYLPRLGNSEPPDPNNLTGAATDLVNAEGATIDLVTYLGVSGEDLTTQAAFCPIGYNVWQVELTMTAELATVVWGGVLSKPGDTTVSGKIVAGGLSASDINGTFQGRIGADGAGDQSINFAGSDIEPFPSLDITKTADPIEVSEPGGDVTFTIRFDNAGDGEGTIETLTDDVYGDLNGQGDCSVPQTIAAGGFYECSFTAFVGGDAGDSHTNVATATDDGGTDYLDDATVTVIGADPSITVTKTADPTQVFEPGGSVTFEVTIENTSVSTDPIMVTSFEDSIEGGTGFTPAGLACEDEGAAAFDLATDYIDPGETITCTFSRDVSGDAGYVENDEVTVDGVDDEGTEVSGSDTAAVTVIDFVPGPGALAVDKKVDADDDGVFVDSDSMDEPGGTVTFKVSITNNAGPTDPITLTSLTDVPYGDLTDDENNDLISNSTCALVTIQPGDTYTCTFDAEVEGNAGEVAEDTVTADGADDEGNPVSDSDSANVVFDDVPSAIEVTKTNDADGDATFSDLEEIDEPGGEVTFKVKVENTSTVDTVTVWRLTDDPHGLFAQAEFGGAEVTLDFSLLSNTCDAALGDTGYELAPSEYFECTFSVNLEGQPGDYLDTVTADAEDDDNDDLFDDDSSTVRITDVPSAIEVIKTADPTSVDEPGGDITYTFTVNNLSVADTVTIDTLGDSIFGDLNGQGDCLVPQDLEPANAGDSDSYTCSITVFVAGNADDTITNVVTASGADDDGNPVSDTDDALVTILNVPSFLDVNKTANPTLVPPAGGDVTYTLTITSRASNVDTMWVDSITDDGGSGTFASIFDIAGASCTGPDGAVTQADLDAAPGVELEPGESITCGYTVTFEPLMDVIGDPPDPANVSVTNVARAEGIDDDDDPVADEDDATVRYFWNGCTPGFWKNHAGVGPQANSWPEGFAWDQALSDYFTWPDALGQSGKGGSGKRSTGIQSDDTLLDALNYRGGNERRGASNILLRAAVAGLLNEAHYGDLYPAYDTEQDLIDAVNTALAGSRSDMLTLAKSLDFWNNGDCDLP